MKKPTQEQPAYWDEAVADLIKKDRILRKLIPAQQDSILQSKNSAFVTLARALVFQSLRSERASEIWAAFKKLCDNSLSANVVVQLELKQLTDVGVAKRKAECLLDLARVFSQKTVQPQKWSKMTDDEIVAELRKIRGVGVWTAQMFLIFHLLRPNVLPLDDPRLTKAISIHYFSQEPVSRYEVRELALNWEPWRTVATWYLWNSLSSQ